MIVPQYWAEARLQHRARDKSVTVRRFGWSDESLQVALVELHDALCRANERLPLA